MCSSDLSSNSNIEKSEILALDVATNCGYHSVHESGSWCFVESKARNDNKQHKALRDTLIGFITKYGIKRIVAEDVVINNHFFDFRRLADFRWILLDVCDTLNLHAPEFINPMARKKCATGNGRATKLDMINACVTRYNYRPKNDDEADALLFYKYYCHMYRIF